MTLLEVEVNPVPAEKINYFLYVKGEGGVGKSRVIEALQLGM